MLVCAPASSANLGPGFDCLGLALELPFLLADSLPSEGRWHEAEPTHPASVAFAAAGGAPHSGLWWRSRIPPGRGLGYSGAARVAGAFLAGLVDGLDPTGARDGAFRVAAELEGHPDNAAASAFGGLTVAAGERAVRLDPPAGLGVVVWSPSASTSTDVSRRTLPEQVPLADAAFSAGRAALWVAAVATGDLAALRTACEDRLHQPGRLGARPDAAAALDRLLASPEVLAAWLSGSGPTVAALVPTSARLGALEASLGDTGQVQRLGLDAHGARLHQRAET